jgi:hypothetical protein
MEFETRPDPQIQSLIQQQSKSWPLVFTHGDLSSLTFLFVQPMPEELAMVGQNWRTYLKKFESL